jgi:tRNA (cytidine/uridine-2'-O-)-methyltransferase
MTAQPEGRVVAAGDVAAAPLHIVLVEPEIPPIEPLGFRIDDRALKRAGLDYWHAVRIVVHPSLDAFLAAFPAERCWWVETTGETPYARAAFARGDALVFGKETGALPQALLDAHPTRTLRIPMRAGAVRSINLSTAAGIVTYAALAALDFPDLA